MPELAPVGVDHLLRSSSVVQKITYSKQSIKYRTFDDSATEVLRLSHRPQRVTAGDAALPLRTSLGEEGFSVDPLPGSNDYVVRILHLHSNMVTITM
jgi:hypothetical protein